MVSSNLVPRVFVPSFVPSFSFVPYSRFRRSSVTKTLTKTLGTRLGQQVHVKHMLIAKTFRHRLSWLPYCLGFGKYFIGKSPWIFTTFLASAVHD